MRASEFDDLIRLLFSGAVSRLLAGASWFAACVLLSAAIGYGVAVLSDAHDDKWDSTNGCVFTGEDGKGYFQGKGFVPVNAHGECNGQGILVNTIEWGPRAEIMKYGAMIAFAPFLLALLNVLILRLRKLGTFGSKLIRTSALKQAVSAHLQRQSAESRMHKAEARSIRMERDLDAAQARLDKLLNP